MTSASTAPTTATSSPSSASTSNADTPPPASAQQEQQEQQEPAQQEPAQQSRRDEHPVSSAESMIPNAQELVAGVASPASTPTGSSGEQEEESGGDKGRAAPVGTEGNKLVIFADTEGGSRALSLQDAQELADVARAKKASLESLKKSPDTLANQFFFMRGVTSFAEFIAKLKENAGNTTGSLYWIDEMGCSALCVILRNNVLVKLSGPYLCTASHITDFIFVESRYTR